MYVTAVRMSRIHFAFVFLPNGSGNGTPANEYFFFRLRKGDEGDIGIEFIQDLAEES